MMICTASPYSFLKGGPAFFEKNVYSADFFWYRRTPVMGLNKTGRLLLYNENKNIHLAVQSCF